MNQKSDAKIRRFGAEYKYLGVFLVCLLRQGGGFATKGRKGLQFCRKGGAWRDLSTTLEMTGKVTLGMTNFTRE